MFCTGVLYSKCRLSRLNGVSQSVHDQGQEHGQGYRQAYESQEADELRSLVTQTSLSIPVAEGRMVLGTWQGLYLAEHRARPHHREIVLHLLGA